MSEVFWVLFFLAGSGSGASSTMGLEGPLGIYTTESKCNEEGELLERDIARRFTCKPLSRATLRYIHGNCLGDNEVGRAILGEACNKPYLERTHD